MVKISFIIPFYNGNHYFEECIDSIYNQDVPQSDFEVIVVDDCSPDAGSVKMLHDIGLQHENFRIVNNDHNMRAGGSRNHGIRESKGKYLWFVDQDDQVEKQCLGHILEVMETDQLDYVSFNYLYFSDKDTTTRVAEVTVPCEVMSGQEYALNVLGGDIWGNRWSTSVWHQVYRKAFLEEHSAYFNEFSFYEELGVRIPALMYAKRMRVIPGAFYHYRLNENSVIHTEVLVGGRPLFDQSLNAGNYILEFSQDLKPISEYFSKYFYDSAIWRINSFTKGVLRISPAENRVFFKYVRLNAGMVDRLMPLLSHTNRLLVKYPWLSFLLYPFNLMFRRIRKKK